MFLYILQTSFVGGLHNAKLSQSKSYQVIGNTPTLETVVVALLTTEHPDQATGAKGVQDFFVLFGAYTLHSNLMPISLL